VLRFVRRFSRHRSGADIPVCLNYERSRLFATDKVSQVCLIGTCTSQVDQKL
jgi:hypothetical protein